MGTFNAAGQHIMSNLELVRIYRARDRMLGILGLVGIYTFDVNIWFVNVSTPALENPYVQLLQSFELHNALFGHCEALPGPRQSPFP